jgi:hypothetical protein
MKAGTGMFGDCVTSPGILEEATMRSSRLVLAAILALLGSTPLRADSYGIGGVGSHAAATSAPVVTLKGSEPASADTIQVFEGRWRPYWRGYYHGSAGYAPRPHLFYGPIIAPRYRAYGYVYRPACSGACVVPCSGGTAMGASAGNPPSAGDPLAVVPAHTPVVSNYRYDGGQSPANGLLPPQTVEPPIAFAPGANRVQATPVIQPVGYAAYGEAPAAARVVTLVKN